MTLRSVSGHRRGWYPNKTFQRNFAYLSYLPWLDSAQSLHAVCEQADRLQLQKLREYRNCELIVRRCYTHSAALNFLMNHILGCNLRGFHGGDYEDGIVFLDIRTQFVPHRKHITSSLQSSAVQCCVRFEVFTAVTTKNAVFWDVTPGGSCKNRRFGGTYRLHHHLRSVLPLLVTANLVPSSPILVTLMMEAIRYSEMSVVTRVTRRNIPEDGILYSHRPETSKLA
jgi:hypothetical protein